MRPVRLELHGFLSYREPTFVDFEDLSAIAIVGENGAGKSSLVDAISWALFGTGRGRSPDDYVSSTSSDCRVRFAFELDGRPFLVERHRQLGKHSKSYLGLFAYDGGQVQDEEGFGHYEDTWRPIGGDAIAETQAAIVELLGMEADLWEATSFIGQGRADAFTQLRPAARKQLLADLLELDRFAVWAEQAKDAARAAAAAVDELDRKVVALKAVAASGHEAEEHLAALQGERDELKLRRETEERNLQIARDRASAFEALTHSRAAAADELARLRSERQAQALELDNSAGRLSLELTQAEEAFATAVQEQTSMLATLERDARMKADLAGAKDSIAEAERDHEDRKHQLQDVNRIVVERETRRISLTGQHNELVERITHLGRDSGTCFTCGQDLPEETSARLIEELRSRLTSVVSQRQENEAEIERGIAARQDLDQLVGGLGRRVREGRELVTLAETGLRSLAELRERQPQIDARVVSEAERVERARAAVEEFTERRLAARDPSPRELELEAQLREQDSTDVDNVRSEIDAHEASLREFDDQAQAIARREGAVEQQLQVAAAAAEELTTAVRDVEALREERDVQTLLADAFGRDGIPTWMIEAAVPELEAEANRLLGQLTADRFTLRIESLKALKGGGTRESLEVIVGDDVSERPLEALSGGERQCVDLSLRIALARLLANRAGRQIETLVIDEGFTALDVAHRQRTIEALHHLVDEFRTVLFVTHLQDLAEAFPSRIQVTRVDGASHVTLEGASA